MNNALLLIKKGQQHRSKFLILFAFHAIALARTYEFRLRQPKRLHPAGLPI
jgi:hypothetical protein